MLSIYREASKATLISFTTLSLEGLCKPCHWWLSPPLHLYLPPMPSCHVSRHISRRTVPAIFSRHLTFPVVSLPAILTLLCREPAAGGLLAADLLAPPELMMKRLYSQANALWGAVQQRSILLPAIFVFLWQASPPKPVSSVLPLPQYFLFPAKPVSNHAVPCHAMLRCAVLCCSFRMTNALSVCRRHRQLTPPCFSSKPTTCTSRQSFLEGYVWWAASPAWQGWPPTTTCSKMCPSPGCSSGLLCWEPP